MSPQHEQSDDVSKVLAQAKRIQVMTLLWSLLAYAAWVGGTIWFNHVVVDRSSLPPDDKSVLHAIAMLQLLAGFATQFMVCNYVQITGRRILQAIHQLARTKGV